LKIDRGKLRPIGLTLAAPVSGFLLVFMAEKILGVELSKLQSSIINLGVVAFIAFMLFPRWLGIPFGRVDTREYLRRVGFYLPGGWWRHVALGAILAGCTLSGMLAASVLTGRYVVDVGAVDVPHLVFSLNPALWEELFFRGVQMVLLLRLTGSLKRASAAQIALFGVMHVKGLDAWAFVDTFSVAVLAVGFTYVAYRTRSLVAGMIFHYLHDAFLKLVQVPGGVYVGVTENAVFFGSLWLMVVVGCIATKLVTERLDVRGLAELYTVGNALNGAE
jgi:membrane protease YdiL (CAAX protease family)